MLYFSIIISINFELVFYYFSLLLVLCSYFSPNRSFAAPLKLLLTAFLGVHLHAHPTH